MPKVVYPLPGPSLLNGAESNVYIQNSVSLWLALISKWISKIETGLHSVDYSNDSNMYSAPILIKFYMHINHIL